MGVVNAEPCGADIFVRRLSTSDIPMESEQATSDWLIKVYQEKVCIYPEREFSSLLVKNINVLVTLKILSLSLSLPLPPSVSILS